MLYQDSRRVVNPNYQEEPKQIKQRSISNTAQLLTWDTYKMKQKTDCSNSYQTSVSDVRPARTNQRNVSSILWDQGFSKAITSKPHYDVNEIMNNQQVLHSTKERVQEKYDNGCEKTRKSLTKFQEKQGQEQITTNKPLQEEILKLHKTEVVQRKNPLKAQQNNNSQDNNLRQRISNYPKKSQSPAPKTLTRPSSAMDDKNVTIISLQLKDMKEDLNPKDVEQLCNNNGYHLVKFDQEFDKINHRIKGQGQIQIRGIYTDERYTNFQRSLSRKGIKIGDQNQKLKDFISNKYLLKKQEHSHMENKPPISQDENLFNNFKKFQSRQKGSFV